MTGLKMLRDTWIKIVQIDNKSEEPINYTVGNLLAHFKRYNYKDAN